MNNHDNQQYNYENDYIEAKKEIERSESYYNAAMIEIKRLQAVAREYDGFYNKIKEAVEKQDWDAVKSALDWAGG